MSKLCGLFLLEFLKICLLGRLSARCVYAWTRGQECNLCVSNLAWSFSAKRIALNLLCPLHWVLVFSYGQPPFSVSRAALFLFSSQRCFGVSEMHSFTCLSTEWVLSYTVVFVKCRWLFFFSYYFRCKSCSISAITVSLFLLMWCVSIIWYSTVHCPLRLDVSQAWNIVYSFFLPACAE